MFGPFPMATVEEQADPDRSPRKSGSPGRQSSTNLQRQDTHHSGDLSIVTSFGSGSDAASAAATPPTDASHPRVGSEPPKLTVQPGNAFSLRAFREVEELKLAKKSPGSSVASRSFDESRRPSASRKPSFGLDYDEELALPMPKPRHLRPDTTETTPLPEEEEDMKPHTPQTPHTPHTPHTLKKRAVTDPAKTSSSRSEPTTPEDGKKKSRLEMIKSRLSFKDLRKESLTDEISSPIPIVPDVPTLMSSENAKPRARAPPARSGIPAFSPSTYNFRAKLKSVEQSKMPAVAGNTGTSAHINATPSKIPLPPSIASSTAPSRRTSTRLASLVDGPTRVDSRGDNNDSQGISAKDRKHTTSASNQPGPDIVVTRPSLEALRQKFRPSTPPRPSLEHPLTDNSPPKVSDLLEGTGKVKYLPRHWIVEEDAATSSPSQQESSVPTAYKKGDPPVETLPDYMMSFKERLEKANIPFDRPIPPEVQNRSIAAYVDDVVEMVRSVQRHTENGIHNVNMKLDDLSSWIGAQLKSELNSIADLARGNSDLFSKQYEVSKEMMKFQLDIRTEIGVMERRLNIFEMKVLDEIQAEMRSITRSQEELTRKNRALEAKLLAQSEESQKYMEEMRRQTEEIEKEVEELQNKRVHPKFLEVEEKLAMLRNVVGNDLTQKNPTIGYGSTNMNPQLLSPASVKTIVATEECEPRNASALGDAETKNQQSPIALHLRVAGQVAATSSPSSGFARTRGPQKGQSKSTSMFPRSISLSKKGFLRNAKGGIGTTQEREPKDKHNLKEKASDQTPAEDTKKWNVFNFRRRRQMSDSAGSNNSSTSSKFNWSSSRRAKETSTINEGSSSRSSTPPIPPIPRVIHQERDKPRILSSSHSMVRAAGMKEAKDGSKTQAAQTQPITAGLIQSHAPHEDSSAHDSVPTSSFTNSSFGDNKLASSSMISPDSFHSAQDRHDPEPPVYTAADDNAQVPLLGDNDQEWDRVSLRESQCREPLV